MQDAKEKAFVLSQAADVTLKDIQSIDYSFVELDFQVNSIQNMLPSKASVPSMQDYDIEIEPDDIDVTDSVTVVWEIE